MDNKATRLAEYIFFTLHLSSHKSENYGYDYYNDGYICGICGESGDECRSTKTQ